MKKNTFNINSLMREINATSKLLKESYLLNEEMPMYGDENDMNGEMYQDDEEMAQNGHGAPMRGEEEMMQQDPHDENMDNEQTNQLIDKIRVLALKGIEMYKNDVDNVYYDTFKKLFLMCDKALSEKDKDNK